MKGRQKTCYPREVGPTRDPSPHGAAPRCASEASHPGGGGGGGTQRTGRRTHDHLERIARAGQHLRGASQQPRYDLAEASPPPVKKVPPWDGHWAVGIGRSLRHGCRDMGCASYPCDRGRELSTRSWGNGSPPRIIPLPGCEKWPARPPRPSGRRTRPRAPNPTPGWNREHRSVFTSSRANSTEAVDPTAAGSQDSNHTEPRIRRRSLAPIHTMPAILFQARQCHTAGDLVGAHRGITNGRYAVSLPDGRKICIHRC